VVAFILLAAQPGGRPVTYPVPLTTAQAEARIDSLGRDYIEMKAAFHPHWATLAGIPGHDDGLARYTPQRVSRSLRRVFGIKRKATSFSEDSLSIAVWVDRQALLAEIATHEYWFAGRVLWRRSPLPYTDAIIEGITGLMLTSGVDSLGEHLASRLAAVANVAADARANITDPIRLHCEVAAADLRAFLPFLDPRSLPADPALAPGSVTAAAVRDAHAAVEAFAGFIDSLGAAGDGDYALGRDEYSAFLETAFMIEEPLEDLLTGAERALEQAHSRTGVLSPALCCGEILRARDPGSRQEALAEFGTNLRAAYDLIASLDLLDLVPADTLLRVVPRPSMGPVLAGALYAPPASSGAGAAGRIYVSFPSSAPGTFGCGAPPARTPLRSHYPALHPAEVRLRDHPSAIRRRIRCPVGRDGWDLYFSMATWQGRDAGQEAKAWAYLAWCAASAIAEIKIHTGEFTLSEAAGFLTGQTGVAPAQALCEVRRYAVAPGRGIGYLIGRNEIVRLRERYKRAKRDSFDLKEFHDTLLSCGHLPPYLLSIEVMSKGMGRE